MLDTLITSKTRMKLLLKFFANSQTRAYLRGLAEELGENTNAIRVELNRFTQAGLLQCNQEGNVIFYKANEKHNFYNEITRLVKKFIGFDSLLEMVIHKLGDVQLAFLTGNYASGVDKGKIDLVIIAEKIDLNYLNDLKLKAEEYLNREILITTMSYGDFESSPLFLQMDKNLILYGDSQSLG